MSAIEPRTARRTHLSAETIHGMIYFTPYGREAYATLGITDQRMGYFASRSAAMGAVPAEVVIATFFNFHPNAVRRVIPAAWEIAAPSAILEARLEAVDRSLRQAWGERV
ncbi:MAG: SCO6745 family protein, partial [Acidimicrobiales bacterium]